MRTEVVQQPRTTYQTTTVYDNKMIKKPTFTMEVRGLCCHYRFEAGCMHEGFASALRVAWCRPCLWSGGRVTPARRAAAGLAHGGPRARRAPFAHAPPARRPLNSNSDAQPQMINKPNLVVTTNFGGGKGKGFFPTFDAELTNNQQASGRV